MPRLTQMRDMLRGKRRQQADTVLGEGCDIVASRQGAPHCHQDWAPGSVSNIQKPRSWLRCSMHTRCSVSNAGAAEA